MSVVEWLRRAFERADFEGTIAVIAIQDSPDRRSVLAAGGLAQ